MGTWEKFEQDSTDCLKQKFGNYADFTLRGGSNSHEADIFVQCRNGESFYIEAKHTPAQCGQFVLLPNTENKSFIYSPQNFIPMNRAASEIKAYMEQYFDDYCNAGTGGRQIDMPCIERLSEEWIIELYRRKGVKFFITNNFIIFPVEEFSRCFNVEATYRVKRSGSSNVGGRTVNGLISHIRTLDCNITEISAEGNKLFVKSPCNIHDKRFYYENREYMFSSRGNVYEVRKLSNTFNANVIFSITLKDGSNGLSDEDFIRYLV